MAANYYKIIRNLIDFKDELIFIEGKKFDALKQFFQSFELKETDDGDNVPNNKEIAQLLNMPHIKVNLLLRELYEKTLELFRYKTLQIKECEQIIHIHLPRHEMKKEIIKKDPDFYSQLSQWIKVKLAVIPRIGEKIRLDFIEYEFGVNSGYVHNVEHWISGNEQRIYIDVHPFDDDYTRWEKMKERYEDKKRLEKYQEYQEKYK